MKLLNRIFLFAFFVFLTAACYADFRQLFVPNGEGALPEKLIVTDANALLYEGFSKSPTQIKPFTILWRLKDKNAKNPNNPVVVHDGKKYYCVGTSEGNQLGYIETNQVTKWDTRFVYTPLPPTGDSVFRVFNKSFSKKEFANASDKQIEEATIAQIVEASAGFASYAYVLKNTSDAKDGAKNQNLLLSVNDRDFNNVMIFNTPIPEKAAEKKNVTSAFNSNDIGLDFVFVIDTTAGMQTTIDMIKTVCVQLEKEVKIANKNRDIVRFGLVEYRDSEADYFGARVVCDLTEGYNTFLNRLHSLKAEGGGDEPDDVMLALKLAAEKAKWRENSSKHIILVGSSPNKQTKAAGAITDFKKLYWFANGDERKASQPFIFHAIVGGNSRNPITSLEFGEIARNNDNSNGFLGAMTNPKIAEDLVKVISAGIKVARSVNSSDEKSKSASAKSKSKAYKKVQGYAAAYTNKGKKCAKLNVMILRSEMEDFVDALGSAHRRLTKYSSTGVNVKVVIDSLLEDCLGISAGEATLEDYEKNLEEILGLQMPVNTQTLKISFKDVMRMNEETRAKWMEDIKATRDRANDLLRQKERWIYSYPEEDEESQCFAFIPIDEMP